MGIHNKDRFMRDVANHFFGATKLRSVHRQLSVWGFKRIRSGDDADAWSHENFFRGRPEDLSKMFRSTSKCRSRPTVPGPHVPNFYGIPTTHTNPYASHPSSGEEEAKLPSVVPPVFVFVPWSSGAVNPNEDCERMHYQDEGDVPDNETSTTPSFVSRSSTKFILDYMFSDNETESRNDAIPPTLRPSVAMVSNETPHSVPTAICVRQSSMVSTLPFIGKTLATKPIARCVTIEIVKPSPTKPVFGSLAALSAQPFPNADSVDSSLFIDNMSSFENDEFSLIDFTIPDPV